MRRTKRTNAKKERIIMIASSVFVLSALTMTGIYMKSNSDQEQDEGYTIDFTALEDNLQDKIEEIEIAKENKNTEEVNPNVEDGLLGGLTDDLDGLTDDLDYLPMEVEVGSGLVTLPDRENEAQEEVPALQVDNPVQQDTPVQEEPRKDTETDNGQVPTETPDANVDTDVTETPDVPQDSESTANEDVIAQTLHFDENDGLTRPVSGEVLIPFSMDKSVYFSTLDQYKYNSAMMIAAAEGTGVSACAEGKVVDIFQNEEIGHAVTMELGDGYCITYGQLKDINVALDSYVEQGTIIASVAAPTKYYSVEGSNLYLKLTADGTPVNPETLFR